MDTIKLKPFLSLLGLSQKAYLLLKKGKKMMKEKLTLLLTAAVIILFGCARNSGRVNAQASVKDYSDDRILTALPYDAIPAILNPEFVPATKAKIAADSPVIGVSFNGESHAYSIYLLNGHEIVNDEVGGVKIATTW